MADKADAVKVVSIRVQPDGSFTVRGTLDRGKVPVVLRSVADHIEESDG